MHSLIKTVLINFKYYPYVDRSKTVYPKRRQNCRKTIFINPVRVTLKPGGKINVGTVDSYYFGRKLAATLLKK